MTPRLDELSAREILINCDREIGLRSFYEFVCLAWSHVPGETYYDETRAHEVICSCLEKVSTGEIRNLLINIPPGFGKSIIAGVLWPIWHWIKYHHHHEDFLFISFDIELMLRDSDRSSTLIADPWFQERWGHLLRLRTDNGNAKQAKGTWSTNKRGVRMSASVGGKITGKHPDIVVIDDPTKPLDATPAELQRSRTVYSGTIANRGKDKRKIRRVCIMQRIADGDLSDLLEELDWHVVRLPFLFDSRIASSHDWRTEEGECLDPKRYPTEVIDAIKRDAQASGTGVWDTQWQQNPAPPGGIIFLAEYWNEYDPNTLPSVDKIDDSCFSWDLTFKGKKTSDFVAGTAWCRIGSFYYLLWAVQGKWDFVQTCTAFRTLQELYPWIMAKLVEDKANGPALASSLSEEIEGILLVDPGGASKVERAHAITPILASGHLRIPKGAPWLEEWKLTHQRFPKAKNDDYVDCTTQALRYLHRTKKSTNRYSGMISLAQNLKLG